MQKKVTSIYQKVNDSIKKNSPYFITILSLFLVLESIITLVGVCYIFYLKGFLIYILMLAVITLIKIHFFKIERFTNLDLVVLIILFTLFLKHIYTAVTLNLFVMSLILCVPWALLVLSDFIKRQ